MLRAPKTLAMLAAAVGVPYTASETEIGRSAVQMLGSGFKTVSSPVNDYLATSQGAAFGDNSHRDVEAIWEQTIDRYRYGDSSHGAATQGPAGPAGVATSSGIGRFASSSARSQSDAPQTSPALSPIDIAMQSPGAVGPTYLTPALPTLVGQPVSDLREVLRFDISPEWVTARFSRVTTVLAEMNLDGLRVPMVSGTNANDLAGSLSYYFDHSDRLQRVSLHGFTGDPHKVVQAMTEHYGLQPEPTLEAGVYTRRWNGVPVHFLRITRAPIVYSDALHHKYTVFLELNQPDLRYGISAEAQRIVSADKATGRW